MSVTEGITRDQATTTGSNVTAEAQESDDGSYYFSLSLSFVFAKNVDSNVCAVCRDLEGIRNSVLVCFLSFD